MNRVEFLLDSANLDDLKQATQLGIVTAVTTNPALMRRVTTDPLAHLSLLAEACDGDLYYQPTGVTGDPVSEAIAARTVAPDRVVLKFPATPDGYRVGAAMVRDGVRVAITAAQYAATMPIAESIGAEAVIPYVDRAIRDVRTSTHLVSALVRLRRGNTRIVAASLKNAGQCVQALEDGADAVTAPLEVLQGLLCHPAALEAEADFADRYVEQ